MADSIVSDLEKALSDVAMLRSYYEACGDQLHRLRAKWERFQVQNSGAGSSGLQYTISMRVSICAYILSVLQGVLDSRIEDVGELALELDEYIVVPDTDEEGVPMDEEMYFNYIAADERLSEYSNIYSDALFVTLQVSEDVLAMSSDYESIIVGQERYMLALDGLSRTG